MWPSPTSFLAAICTFAASVNAQTAPSSAPTTSTECWIDITPGTSLVGWRQLGGNAEFRVADAVVIGSTRPNEPNSFLCTDAQYADFELEFEFKIDPRLNSGVQIRSHSIPSCNDGRVRGYQIEIDPSPRAWTAGIYDEGRRGWLAPIDDDAVKRAFLHNHWNRVRVVALGHSIRTWLNGVPAADLTDDLTPSGFIALQVHSVGEREEPLEVQWRRIRIRQINSAPGSPTSRPG